MFSISVLAELQFNVIMAPVFFLLTWQPGFADTDDSRQTPRDTPPHFYTAPFVGGPLPFTWRRGRIFLNNGLLFSPAVGDEGPVGEWKWTPCTSSEASVV